MTDQELKEIEDRANNATAPPWRFTETKRREWMADPDTDDTAEESEEFEYVEIFDYDPDYDYPKKEFDGSGCGEPIAEVQILARTDKRERYNAEFIAHSREDVPRLIEEIKRLRALLGNQAI